MPQPLTTKGCSAAVVLVGLSGALLKGVPRWGPVGAAFGPGLGQGGHRDNGFPPALHFILDKATVRCPPFSFCLPLPVPALGTHRRAGGTVRKAPLSLAPALCLSEITEEGLRDGDSAFSLPALLHFQNHDASLLNQQQTTAENLP